VMTLPFLFVIFQILYVNETMHLIVSDE